MALSKEEKKNVIIAAMLCIAAVIIIWLWGHNQVTGGTTVGDTNLFPSTGIPANPDSYITYNLPAYVPPNLTGVGPANPGAPGGAGGNNGGCGCADVCGPPGGTQAVSIPFWNLYLTGMLGTGTGLG